MVNQKNDESIEEIDREILVKYIETKEFLAVMFCKEQFYFVIIIFYTKIVQLTSRYKNRFDIRYVRHVISLCYINIYNRSFPLSIILYE